MCLQRQLLLGNRLVTLHFLTFDLHLLGLQLQLLLLQLEHGVLRGLLCLLPLFIALQTDQQIVLPAGVVVLHMLVVGTLMASRIPTYSGKQVKIRHETIPHFMLAGSLLLVLFIIEPWLSIVLLSVAYLVSVVFSVRHWRALSAATPQTDA